MPFGVFYATLFLGGTGIGLLWLAPGAPWGLRIPLAALCWFMAVALLRRRRWARWAALFVALLIVPAAWPLFGDDTGVVSLAVSLAGVVSALLLLVPGTGSYRRDADGSGPTTRNGLGLEAATALAAVAAGVALGLFGLPTPSNRAPSTPTVAAGDGGQTARQSAATDRVRWSDYGAGLERAREQDSLMMVAFMTQWCGYCKKMDRTTWNSPDVVDRFAELVAVRVDADETKKRHGHSGTELARRFGVHGFPTLVLLDSGGRELDRVSGYLAPSQVLSWIDAAAGRGTGGSRRDAVNTSQ